MSPSARKSHRFWIGIENICLVMGCSAVMNKITQNVLASHLNATLLSGLKKYTEKVIFNSQLTIENEMFMKKINSKLLILPFVLKKMGTTMNSPNTGEVKRMIGNRFRILFLMVMLKIFLQKK